MPKLGLFIFVGHVQGRSSVDALLEALSERPANRFRTDEASRRESSRDLAGLPAQKVASFYNRRRERRLQNGGTAAAVSRTRSFFSSASSECNETVVFKTLFERAPYLRVVRRQSSSFGGDATALHSWHRRTRALNPSPPDVHVPKQYVEKKRAAQSSATSITRRPWPRLFVYRFRQLQFAPCMQCDRLLRAGVNFFGAIYNFRRQRRPGAIAVVRF